jgi:hypothetical protein
LSNRSIAAVLMAIVLAEPVLAAEPDVLKTSWNGFQEQVSARRLKGRPVQIVLSGGKRIKTSLVEVTDTDLLVRSTRATKQWKVVNDQARIPKEQVSSVRFAGRTGKGKLIGGVAGFGAGAGIAAAATANTGITEGSFVILLPVIGVAIAASGALAGYFIGRSLDQPGPEFVLTR